MTTRAFQLSEGTSQKFWHIALEGASTTVEYGRIGTAGQAQTKAYADAATAQAAYVKLIAEKVKKGYSEVGITPIETTSSAPAVSLPAAPRAAQPIPKPAPEPAPTALLPTDEPVRLALEPSDYIWATWRAVAAVPRPPTPPFNQADALRRLTGVAKDSYFGGWNWERAQIPRAPSREEAQFWLAALRPPENWNGTTPKQVAAQLAGQTFDGALSGEQAVEMVNTNAFSSPPITMALLAPFCTLDELLDLFIGAGNGANAHNQPRGDISNLLGGLRAYVLPFVSLDERQRLSAKLAPYLANIVPPQDYYTAFAPAVYLAAMLGGHGPALTQLVESWADNRYSSEGWHAHYQSPQDIVFGLDDPGSVEYHTRRLKLPLHQPMYIRGWLAHTEWSALDYARDNVLNSSNKEEAAALIEALGCAIGPQTAPHMLQILHESRAPQAARNWLEAHPGHTIAGLVPLAAGRGKLAEAASDILRRFARRGYLDTVAAALPALNDEGAAKLRATVLDVAIDTRPPLDEAAAPDDLRAAFVDERAAKKPKQPVWLVPADLPSVAIDGQVLSAPQVALLLHALQRSKLDAPAMLVDAMRRHAEPASRDAFVWTLFEQWLAEGAPSKENWVMQALGLLGGDSTALRLAPLVRTWPGESQHQRAIYGLECLRTIGTDTALMQLNGIAQKVKFKGLQARAAECMEEIAKARHMSRAELEDRIVPDCDLDERGERVFSFGPRQFRFALGPDLKPMVRDEAGKFKTDLPKPTAKDDATSAAQAIAEWKLLKKQVGEVAKVQALRLEQAMVIGRRWPRATFELLIVRHPLMTHLARPLIWGAYNAAGKLAATFRVTEDQTYADGNDDTFDLAPFAAIGIVHPLYVAQSDQAAWGEVLSDYELIPPFPQLGRPIYQLEATEQQAIEITRFNNVTIAAASLVFGLDKQGWQRDAPADGGGFSGHFKPFYQANITAVVQYGDGVAIGYIVDAPDQHLHFLAFVPGIREAEYWPNHTDRLNLHDVDPVVISEALSDVTVVMAKAK